MKNIRKISYAAAVLVVTSATSCKKQLEEYNPHSATVENMYNTPGGINGLVNMAYQDLRQIFGIEDGVFMCESGTDLWYNAGKAGYGSGITQYLALTAGKPSIHQAHWKACFRGINYCNTGIELIDKAGFVDEAEKNTRLSELRFLRALYYYHIVEQYGGVYLNTKSSLNGVELNPTRSTPEEFYDLMIGDLEFAKNNLPAKWSEAEYSRASKKSALGLLARVLLTRAYYSTGGDAQAWFTKAKDAAVEAINSAGAWGLSLYKNYADIGQSVYGATANRAANKEAMFVLAYSEANNSFNTYTTQGTGGNRIFKWMLTKYSGRPGMLTTTVKEYGIDNEQRLMPTWHLLDLFDETKDVRYNANFQEYWKANVAFTWKTDNKPAETYEKDPSIVGQTITLGDTAMYLTKKILPYDVKFKRFMAVGRNELYKNPEPGKGAAITDSKILSNYFPSFKKFVNINRTTTVNTDYGDALIIRLAEMYMIAAEASVQLGDQASAANYVNVIRGRAALTPGALDVTPGDVNIDFILDERAREFVGEQQRWYDLKRVFHDKQAWAAYIKKWNPDLVYLEPYHWVRPIPQAEYDGLADPKAFGQNEGYPQP